MNMILPTHETTLLIPDRVNEINKLSVPTERKQQFLSDTWIQTVKGLSVLKSQQESLVMEFLEHIDEVGIKIILCHSGDFSGKSAFTPTLDIRAFAKCTAP